MKRFVRNQTGFTLLESILQLAVFTLFSAISLLIFIWIKDFHSLEDMKNDVDWELFVYDLQQYNDRSKSGKLLANDRLQFEIENEDEGRFFIFEKSGDNLRKRSNLGGHELLLPYVTNWNLVVAGNDIVMKVVMQDGTKRERKMVLPHGAK